LDRSASVEAQDCAKVGSASPQGRFHSILSQIAKLGNFETAGNCATRNLTRRSNTRVSPSTLPCHPPCATTTTPRAPSSPNRVTAKDVRSWTGVYGARTYKSKMDCFPEGPTMFPSKFGGANEDVWGSGSKQTCSFRAVNSYIHSSLFTVSSSFTPRMLDATPMHAALPHEQA